MVRVLMSAYACEPQQGSEPAVGWHWAWEAASAGHEVWVVTRRNNREVIEAALPGMLGPRPQFEYVDLPGVFRWLKRRGGHFGLIVYYYLWQIAIVPRALRLHRELRFDVVHHVTFVNDTLPSGLSMVPAPFVWGPIGGSSHRIPKTVRVDLPRGARWYERMRSAAHWTLRRADPFVILTRHRATAILVYTREALKALPPPSRRRARSIIHIGMSPTDVPDRDPGVLIRDGSSLVVVTGGRLVHWKGYDLVVRGFAQFLKSTPTVNDARLVVTGAGPYRGQLEVLARELGVSERVAFTGRLATRELFLSALQQADVFALPTLRDGPPLALIEAMACGLPVICLDIGAVAEMVPSFAGVKIPPLSADYVVNEIACSLQKFNEDIAATRLMGRAGKAFVEEHYAWNRIQQEINRTYRDVVR